MKIAKNKLRIPNWDNYLLNWRDYPYDKDRVEKNKKLLHSIFDSLEKNDLVDKDFCKVGNLVADELAEQASYFMDIAFELSRGAKSAQVPHVPKRCVYALLGIV